MRDRVREEQWFNAQVMQEAARWVEQNLDAKRLFLTVESFDPHEPWFVPEHYRRRYDASDGPRAGDLARTPRCRGCREDLVKRTRANYAGLVEMCDRWFGHLIETLRVTGVLDEALVIVTSDHGHSMWERRGYIGKRGYPSDPESYELPLLVRHPQKRAPARVCNAFVQHHDITATMLDAAGITPPAPIDGLSFWNTAFDGGKPKRDHVTIGWGSAMTVDRRRLVVQRQDQRARRVPARFAATRARRAEPRREASRRRQAAVRDRQGGRRRLVSRSSCSRRPRAPTMRPAAARSPRSASADRAEPHDPVDHGLRGSNAAQEHMSTIDDTTRHGPSRRGGCCTQGAALGAAAIAAPWVARYAHAQAADLGPYQSAKINWRQAEGAEIAVAVIPASYFDNLIAIAPQFEALTGVQGALREGAAGPDPAEGDARPVEQDRDLRDVGDRSDVLPAVRRQQVGRAARPLPRTTRR